MPRRIRVVLIGSLILTLATPVLAEFTRDYRSAMKALRNEQWDRAALDFRRAIADNPNPSPRERIYGMRFDAYLPYYHLGEAYYRAGDCERALEAWSDSLGRGVIQSQPQFSDLQSNMASCQRSAVDFETARANAKSAIAAFRETIGAYQALKQSPAMADEWTEQSPWQVGLDRARQQIDLLERDLSSAEAAGDGQALQNLAEDSGGLNADLAALLKQAKLRVASSRQANRRAVAEARNRARQELLRVLASARAIDTSGAEAPEVRRLAGELRSMVSRAESMSADAAPEDLAAIGRNIRSKQRDLALAVQEWQRRQQALAQRTPPPDLREAVAAYFSGDYARASSLLDPDQFSEGRERIQAHLFRAAARFNRFELEGHSDQALLQAARNDIRAIKRIDAGFSPYLAAFSPKFLELFEDTP